MEVQPHTWRNLPVSSQSLDVPARPGLAARETPGIEPEEQCRKRIGRYEIGITHGPPSDLAVHSLFALH